MQKAVSVVIVILAVFTVAAGQSAELAKSSGRHAARALTEQQQGWLRKAWRFEKDGWIYLHVEGEARERGFQHGYLLAPEIDQWLRAEKEVWWNRHAKEWSWLVEKADAMFVPLVDAENLAEIDGIAEGFSAAGFSTSRAELVAYNGIIELGGYWWPIAKETLEKEKPTEVRKSCSALAHV